MNTTESHHEIKRIGVLTSGGDAPGMNAAIRAITRTALKHNISVVGIEDGYIGLYHNRVKELTSHDVENIINRGGTFLGTARFVEFAQAETRAVAIENLHKNNIDALVVIGGDGSYMGALRLTESGIPCIGVPATIDNDITGTDYTIGFDTALNTIVHCMDNMRDTCNSHRRVTIVEIMGRHCGDLTLHAGIAGGCEFAIIPEKDFNLDEIIANVDKAFKNGKRHGLIALCENLISAEDFSKRLNKETGIESRAVTLGHLQRGGNPTANDRILASRLGEFAVQLLIKGVAGECVGIEKGLLVHHPIHEQTHKKPHYYVDDMFDICAEIA